MGNAGPIRTEQELQELATIAMQRSGAAGVAIALPTDGRIVCRARAGEMTPPLGALAESGISGEVLRTGELIRCDDTEHDPRVNVEVCRQLGIRSMVLVPVPKDGATVGLVSAFAPEPQGLDEQAIYVLQAAASYIYGPHAANAAAAREDVPQIEPRPSRPKSWIAPLVAVAVVAAAVGLGLLTRGDLGRHLRFGPLEAHTGNASAPSEPPSSSASPSPEGPLDGLSLAAAAGDPTAQKELGDAYASGDGVKRDLATASAWYILASQNGNTAARDAMSQISSGMPRAEVARARYEVGRLYAAGRGTPPDRVAAYRWFLLARELGSAEANQAMAVLRQLMTAQQLEEANRSAAAWLGNHRRTQR